MNVVKRFLNWQGTQKHQRIIISFCNLTQISDSGLLLFDLCCSKGRWLNLGLPTQVTSCTGICQIDTDILTLVEFRDEVYIVVINSQDFRPKYYQRLFEIRNPHSVCVARDQVLIVSTGTDEVVAYERVSQRLAFRGSMWTAGQSNKDTHHMNSITYVDDENIWVTAFGPKTTELWQSASNGYICNIKNSVLLKTGINQPHSLRTLGSKVYYCESALQELATLDSGTICRASGYTRGLCFPNQNTAIFGTSVGRKKSKSMGVMRNPADPGEPFGTCSITEVDLQTGRTLTTDMSRYGREIYDIHHVI